MNRVIIFAQVFQERHWREGLISDYNFSHALQNVFSSCNRDQHTGKHLE